MFETIVGRGRCNMVRNVEGMVQAAEDKPKALWEFGFLILDCVLPIWDFWLLGSRDVHQLLFDVDVIIDMIQSGRSWFFVDYNQYKLVDYNQYTKLRNSFISAPAPSFPTTRTIA